MKLLVSGMILLLSSILTAQDQKTVDSLISILFHSQDVQKVNTYNQLSSIHIGSNPSSAAYYAEEAEKLAHKLGYKKGMADANRNKGLNSYNQADYAEALSYYHKALSIFEEIDIKEGIADVYNNIAIILDDQNQFESAKEYYNKSLSLYEYLNDKPGIAMVVMNLGVTFHNKGAYAKALEYYKKSLRLHKDLNDQEGIADCYNNIGEIYLKENKYADAIYYYECSLQINRRTNTKPGIVLCLVNLGACSNESGEYSKSLIYSSEGLKLANQLNSRDDIRLIYENLSNSYAGMKDYKNAYYYHKLFKNISDSIFNEKNSKNLHEVHEKYEHEKMRQEVQLQRSLIKKKELELRHQITIKFAFIIGSVLLLVLIFILARSFEHKRKTNLLLAEQNSEILKQKEYLVQTAERLSDANATKDKLFSIIAHDLRSPFTSLMGYSQLLKENINVLDKTEITEFAGSINQSSKIVYNLLENLLVWSRFQNGKISFSPCLFDFHLLAAELLELFHDVASDKKISLINSVYPSFYMLADKHMLETIVRNLVSNALKFTMEGGSVEIIAQRKEQDAIISVEDNGIGIPPENLKKLFTGTGTLSTFGTRKEQGTGLGLLICKEFVERHDGSIWVESHPGKGSRFSFLIPDQDQD